MNARAAALVAGLATAAWIASRDLAPIAIPTIYTGYQPADPLVAQLIEPVLHAPWVGAASFLFAGLLALCLASEAWLLSIVYGASAPAAAAAAIATIATAPWTDSVRHGGSLPIALAFSWLAWLLFQPGRPPGGDREGDPPPRGPAFAGTHESRALARLMGVGLVSWIAAIAASWLAIISAPMVLAALTIGEHRKRVRAGFVVAGVLAGLAGVALYCARVAALTTSLTANGTPAVSGLDVLVQLFEPTHGPMTSGGHDLGAASLLAIALAALGAAGATTRRRWRGGVVLSALVGAGVAAMWPFWRVAVCHLVLWLSTPFVAVGLTLLARTIAPRRQAIATVMAGAVLCAVSISDRFTFQAAPSVSPGEPLTRVLGSLAADAALFVVEDLDVDAAIVASNGAHSSGWRVAQDPAYVRELVDAGRTIVAGPMARRNLELAGLRFQGLNGDGDAAGFTLSSVIDQLHCAVVRSDRWSLLPGVEYTGRLGVQIPGGLGGAMTLVAGDDDYPPLMVTNTRGDVQKVSVEPLLTAPSVDAPPPDYWFDDGDPARAPSRVVRVRLPAHPTAPTLLDLSLGRRAPRVLARLMNFDEGARGRVCAAPLAAAEVWADPNAPRELNVPLNSVTMLTAGWYGLEGAAGAGQYRWTDGLAVALIPSALRTAVRIALDAEPAAVDGEPPTLMLRVNGVEQPAHDMRAGRDRYEWPISARTWLAGTNELVFSISRVLRPTDVGGQDSRVLGMKVARLALTRMNP